MDDYSSWDKETGLEYILQTYDRDDAATDIPSTLEPEEQEIVRKNIQTNLVDLANRHPDVQFYMIYTPYSICYFDSLMQEGSMERQFAAEKMATEMLLECENVKLACLPSKLRFRSSESDERFMTKIVPEKIDSCGSGISPGSVL